MKLRNKLQTDIEAALAEYGPLALDGEAFARSIRGYIIPPGQTADTWMCGMVSMGSTFQFESVGNVSLNGDGYTRVAAVNGRAVAKGSKTAIIPIMGPVIPFAAPKWLEDWGIRVASLPNIVTAARAAANDPEVGRIMYAVHTPGGSAFGVDDAYKALAEVSKVKQTVTSVTYLMASAGYWLGASAREIVAAPSALIGSVGVRMTHVDYSKQLEADGVKVTELSTPASKTDISSFKPLSDTARAEYMRMIDDAYAAFSADISAARRIDMVKNGEQYGRVHPAGHAKSIGMIDRVATIETLLGESAPPADLTSTRRARLAIMEREYPDA